MGRKDHQVQIYVVIRNTQSYANKETAHHAKGSSFWWISTPGDLEQHDRLLKG